MAQVQHQVSIPSTFVAVIDPNLCVAYPVDLTCTTTETGFLVTDVNDNAIFNMKEKLISLHDKRTLFDSCGHPLVTIKEKILTMHDQHFVYRGAYTDESELLFVVRRSSLLMTKYNIFLANNKKMKHPDFVAKGLTIYSAKSKIILAKVTHEEKDENKKKFKVTISCHVDYAFIITLLAIIGDIHSKHIDYQFENQLVHDNHKPTSADESEEEEGNEEELKSEKAKKELELKKEKGNEEELKSEKEKNELELKKYLINEAEHHEDHVHLITMIKHFLGNLCYR
ncbi:hypothetical protein ACFE04_014737 [Oxalis oulophora]